MTNAQSQVRSRANEAVFSHRDRDYELTALVGEDRVVLGWTVADHVDRSDLLGFGIRRSRLDPESREVFETQWATQPKHFQGHNGHGRRRQYSTRTDPLQRFNWCDASIEQGAEYAYSVMPMRGTPALMYEESPISVALSAAGGRHRRDSVERRFDEAAADLVSAADSCVFVCSDGPLPALVLDAIHSLDASRLVFGIVPGTGSADLPANVRIVAPGRGRACGKAGASGGFSTAIVTDPWSKQPRTLRWDQSGPADEGVSLDESPHGAAQLAVSIYSGFVRQSEAKAAKAAGSAAELLLTDGRWSGIYFSPSSASCKYREREVLAGRP